MDRLQGRIEHGEFLTLHRALPHSPSPTGGRTKLRRPGNRGIVVRPCEGEEADQMTKLCSVCGPENREDAKFCRACGTASAGHRTGKTEHAAAAPNVCSECGFQN